MKFTDFNLSDSIQQAVSDAGFKEPSPVQKEAIPLIIDGYDIIAQAQTGTGKTAAFGLPILSQMKANGTVEGLVIVPTRELAMQVSDELYRFGRLSGLRTATVYGGTPYGKQIERIKQASVVIATPGRLQDLLMSGKINIKPKYVVLDEADEMLDMGFLDEIKNIFTYLPEQRQTLMFSATMPKAIRVLAQEILNDPKTVSITKAESTNTDIKQLYYVVNDRERNDALVRLIDFKNPTKAIVFCRMKMEVDRLISHLTSQGFKVGGLHGDMEQKQREISIKGFKNGAVDIFVATDVAARGLDVNDVSHVFNYHIPFDSESYVHRIGRTGRAGKTGEAITLVSPNELRTIKRIEKDVGTRMVTEVIPTKEELVKNKESDLLMEVAQTTITDEAVNMVRTLQHDLDIVTIAHLLASMIKQKDNISGKDKIGFNLEEIKRLIERMQNDRGSNRKRSGNRSRSRRNRSNHRNDRSRDLGRRKKNGGGNRSNKG